MITFPTTLAEAAAAEGVVRAGGTDLVELRHRHLHTGDLVDLRDLPGLDTIETTPEGGLRIGARVTLATLATDERTVAGYPGLVQAAGGLATPQIRARATLGGSLLQEVRCWYYRHPTFGCLKKGGAVCYAREGDHQYHATVDLGPCIAPHPSTMACALWAFDGLVEINGDAEALRTLPELLGDGTDPRQTHALGKREVLSAVVLPPPVEGEHSAYFRTIHRARAEWPLVEATVRVSLKTSGRIDALVLCAGGVANRPLRYDDAARAARGLAPDGKKLDKVLANLAEPDARLPMSAYKGTLVPPTLTETLTRALDGTAAVAFATPQPVEGEPTQGEETE
jgi:xanthine dehydrogenase YagS FAD-binding subunit